MKTVTLGWNSSDHLAGVLRVLSEELKENEPLKALYQAVSSGSSEPIKIVFNDNVED